MKDYTSGVIADTTGIDFDYVSAPVDAGRLQVQMCGGFDAFIKSDIDADVNYQLISEFGERESDDQIIPQPSGAAAFRKAYVNVGIDGSFVQYRIHGTTTVSASTYGYDLYGINYWTEQGKSPR